MPHFVLLNEFLSVNILFLNQSAFEISHKDILFADVSLYDNYTQEELPQKWGYTSSQGISTL